MPDARENLRTNAIVVLAIIAVVAALYLASELLAPIALAILLSALFRPLARLLERVRIPTPLAAAIIVLGLIGAMVAGGFALAGPIRGWVTKAPETLAAAEGKLAKLRQPVQKIANAADRITQAGSGSSASTPTSGPSTLPMTDPSAPATPPPPEPGGGGGGGGAAGSIAVRFLGSTTRIVGQIVEVVLLLYLILASGSAFREKLVRSLPGA